MVGKHVFWQALVLTILVFGAGVLFGFFMESARYDRVEFDVMQSEINLLDEQIRGDLIDNLDIECSLAKASLFSFADKVYYEALKLEDYDASSKFGHDSMVLLHKKYDLLRLMLWRESVDLRERCPDFHTVVLLFDYFSEDVEVGAKQEYYSRLIIDLKNEYPGEIVVIPIAANLDISSVELFMESYDLGSPMIFVDRDKKIDSIITLSEFENIVFEHNRKLTVIS